MPTGKTRKNNQLTTNTKKSDVMPSETPNHYTFTGKMKRTDILEYQ